jgi:hypothetical protein
MLMMLGRAPPVGEVPPAESATGAQAQVGTAVKASRPHLSTRNVIMTESEANTAAARVDDGMARRANTRRDAKIKKAHPPLRASGGLGLVQDQPRLVGLLLCRMRATAVDTTSATGNTRSTSTSVIGRKQGMASEAAAAAAAVTTALVAAVTDVAQTMCGPLM